MVDMTAECPFCGQSHMIKIYENATNEEMKQEAAKLCTCEDAKRYQETESKIAVAQMTIRDQMSYNEAVRPVLEELVELVGRGYLGKVTLVSGKSTTTVKDTTKGIMIEKKVVHVEKHEA